MNRRSVAWITAETMVNTLLMLGTMLLMARLVGPSEFARAALLIGLVQLVNLYVEGFFHDALIQHREAGEDAFASAFWVVQWAGLLGLMVAAGGCALAGPGWARDAALLLAAAASLPFSGATGIMNARLRREFRHDRVAQSTILSRLLAASAGIGVAAAGAGAWGLVTQFTVAAAANAALLAWRSGWRPRRTLSVAALRPLVRFALPNAAMHTLSGARLQGFTMLVAGLLGLTAAGYVNMAFRLVTTPQVILNLQLMNLGFPVLARQQADRVALTEAYRLVTKMVTTAALPIFAGLALVAGDVVPLVLGPGWMPSVPLLQILALGAALGFLRLAGSFLLRALGHVRFSFHNAVIQLVLTLGGLLLLRPSDPAQAVVLWVLPAMVTAAATLPIVRRVAGIDLTTQLRAVLPSLTATLAMAMAVLSLPQLPVAADLVCKALVGATTFATALLLLDRDARDVARRFLHRAEARPG
nr:oligosaccharide flippase family protein [Paracraurococcus ruber]